jgi:CheY-like chemotaxis protein
MPIIGLTSHTGSEAEEACYKSGMDDYLTKPFDPEHLRKVLLRWVYQPSRPNLKLLQGFHVDDQEFKGYGS